MSQHEVSPLVLIVDDDEIFLSRLRKAFIQRSWEADTAPNGQIALKIARERSPDLVLVDLRMPGVDGLDVVFELRGIDSSTKIIVLTGYGSIPTTISAMKRGADYYLSKPADADQILAAYERLQRPDSEVTDIPTVAASLARVEWEHMQRVIADCEGNISQAARALGIHRRSLQRKLSKNPPSR